MKRIIVLSLCSFVFYGYCYSYSLTTSTNSIRVGASATVTLDVSPGNIGDYSYAWTKTTGTITGTGNSVTFTAPNAKAKAGISVTATSLGTGATVYQGTVYILVYKSLFIIKCDDYRFDSTSPSTNYMESKYKQYTDFMESTHVKCAIGMQTKYLEDANATFVTAINAMINRGYIAMYHHGYAHGYGNYYERFTLVPSTYEGAVVNPAVNEPEQLRLLQLGETLSNTVLGFPLYGFGSPGNQNNNETGIAMNQVPEMKFFLFPEPCTTYAGINFWSDSTRLNCEENTTTINYTLYLSQYASYGSRPVNVIQIHPIWWDGSAMGQWQRVIAHIKAQGITVINPMDYVNMVSSPTFVPDEGPPPDTTPPGAPAAVRDGTGTDISTTTNTTRLYANWDAATDNESAITAYWYAIGTTAGGTDKVNWTNNGTSRTVNKTGTYTANQTYYFTVEAESAGGMGPAANSNGQQVVSLSSDTTPPVISAVAAGNLSMAGAQITWTTNETATSQVEYGLTASYGITTLADITMVTSHSIDLSGLTANTSYHYRVKSNDGSGNPAASADYTFTTTNTPAPVISAVSASSITTTGAKITWTTDVTATSQVEYGTMTSYGNTTLADITLVTSHSVDLSGLTANTSYYYRVKSSDGYGSSATGVDYTFATANIPAPVISAVAVINITTTGAKVTWTTDVTATSQVEYGLSAGYGNTTTLDSTPVTGHSVDLSGLSANTQYHYRVKSAKNSVESVNTDGTFTTAEVPAVTVTPATVKAYPNPCDFSGNHKMTFTIDGAEGGNVKIYTMDGILTRTLPVGAGSNTIEWDGKDDSGQDVKSGVYVYVSAGSGKQKGKVMVVR